MDPGESTGADPALRRAIRAALVCALLGGAIGVAGLLGFAITWWSVLPRSRGLAVPLAPVLGLLGAGSALMLIGAAGASAARLGDGPRAMRGLRWLALGAAVAGLPAVVWAGHLAWFVWAEPQLPVPTRIFTPPPPPPIPWGAIVLTSSVLGLPWFVALAAGWTRWRHGEALRGLEAGDDSSRAPRRRLIALGAIGIVAIAGAHWARANGLMAPPTRWSATEAIRALDHGRLGEDARVRLLALGSEAAPVLLAHLDRSPSTPGAVVDWFEAWLDAVQPIVPALGQAGFVPPSREGDILEIISGLGFGGAVIADDLFAWARRNPRFAEAAAASIGAMGVAALPALERDLAAHPSQDRIVRGAIARMLDLVDALVVRPDGWRNTLKATEGAALRARMAQVIASRGVDVISPLLVLLNDGDQVVARTAAHALDFVYSGDHGAEPHVWSDVHGNAWTHRWGPEPGATLVQAFRDVAESGPSLARGPAIRALLALCPYQPEAAEALANIWSVHDDLWPGAPRWPLIPLRLVPGFRAVAAVAGTHLATRVEALLAERLAGERDVPLGPDGKLAPLAPETFGGFELAILTPSDLAVAPPPPPAPR